MAGAERAVCGALGLLWAVVFVLGVAAIWTDLPGAGPVLSSRLGATAALVGLVAVFASVVGGFFIVERWDARFDERAGEVERQAAAEVGR